MEGDYLATHALALACSGRPLETQELVEASEAVSSHLDALALRYFARTIASYSERGELDASLRNEALATTRLTGNYDTFVCAYRAFPPLLEDLGAIDFKGLTPLGDVVCSRDPKLAEKIGLLRPRPPTRSGARFTPREREIVGFIKRGSSNREIARALWISESTVKVHVHHVLEKMNARSRTEIAALELDD
jgi:DNA-binding CsgD family transcriptional regulator